MNTAGDGHGGKAVLLVVAAPAEAAAVASAFDAPRFASKEATPVRWGVVRLQPGVEMVVTGVGKANAAAGVARVFDPLRHVAVVNVGVGGSLPRSGLGLLDVVVATRSEYADEGVRTPERFIDMAACGFPPGQGMDGADVKRTAMGVEGDAALVALLCERLPARAGVVATVSTCSGRNRLAVQVVERTGAIVEAMEGAAVGFTVRRIAHEARVKTAFIEVRVVSNSTGNRAKQRWDLKGALGRLGDLARGIIERVAT